MRAALAIAASIAVAAPAAADPLELAEQPRPLAPAAVSVQVDTGFVGGASGVDARGATVVVGLHGRRGGWMLEGSFGAQRWSDRIEGVGVRTMRGFQPTNPTAAVTRWWRPQPAFAIGLHGAIMLAMSEGVTRDGGGAFVIYPDYDVKAPSQLVRLGALPYDRPRESALRAGLTTRVDQPRWAGQLTIAVDYVRSKYEPHSPDATPPRWFGAGGVAVRLAPSLALIGHALVTRSLRYEKPVSAVAGAGLAIAIAPGTLTLRAETRLDACELGEGAPAGARSGTCTRVLAAYDVPLAGW